MSPKGPSKLKYSRLDQVPESSSEETPEVEAHHKEPKPSNEENDDSDQDSDLFLTPEMPSHATEGSSVNLSSDHGNPSSISELHQNTSQQELPSVPRGPLTKKQRVMNVIHYFFPVRQTYERLNNGLQTGRMQANLPGSFVGQGTDGVFRNLMAKPDTEAERVTQEQHPPTYEEAAADASPEYWETTMLGPMYENEVFVQGLSVGNLANFVWNALVTVAFQLVGFILCYLLHTSHAAKQGTRAGLGVMFIMFGYDRIPSNFGRSDKIPVRYEPDDPDQFDITKSTPFKAGSKVDSFHLLMFSQQDSVLLANTKTPYLAYGLIAFGLFIIIKAEIDYYKVKQKEKQILAPRALEEV